MWPEQFSRRTRSLRLRDDIYVRHIKSRPRIWWTSSRPFILITDTPTSKCLGIPRCFSVISFALLNPLMQKLFICLICKQLHWGWGWNQSEQWKAAEVGLDMQAVGRDSDRFRPKLPRSCPSGLRLHLRWEGFCNAKCLKVKCVLLFPLRIRTCSDVKSGQ